MVVCVHMTTQTISITKARNEFFDLLMQSYNNDQVFAVEKNGILVGGDCASKNH